MKVLVDSKTAKRGQPRPVSFDELVDLETRVGDGFSQTAAATGGTLSADG
jgi:hypothetical protein